MRINQFYKWEGFTEGQNENKKESISTTDHLKQDLETLADILQDNNIFLSLFSAVSKELSQFQQHIKHDFLNRIVLSKEGFTNSTEFHS